MCRQASDDEDDDPDGSDLSSGSSGNSENESDDEEEEDVQMPGYPQPAAQVTAVQPNPTLAMQVGGRGRAFPSKMIRPHSDDDGDDDAAEEEGEEQEQAAAATAALSSPPRVRTVGQAPRKQYAGATRSEDFDEMGLLLTDSDEESSDDGGSSEESDEAVTESDEAEGDDSDDDDADRDEDYNTAAHARKAKRAKTDTQHATKKLKRQQAPAAAAARAAPAGSADAAGATKPKKPRTAPQAKAPRAAGPRARQSSPVVVARRRRSDSAPAAEREEVDAFTARVNARTEAKLAALKSRRTGGTPPTATPPSTATPSPGGTSGAGAVGSGYSVAQSIVDDLADADEAVRLERVPLPSELKDKADRLFTEARKFKHASDDLSKEAERKRKAPGEGAPARALQVQQDAGCLLLRSCFKFLLATAGFREDARELATRARGYNEGTPQRAQLLDRSRKRDAKATEVASATVALLLAAAERLGKARLPALEVVALAARAGVAQRELISRVITQVSSDSRKAVQARVLEPARMDPRSVAKGLRLGEAELAAKNVKLGEVAHHCRRIHRDSKDAAAACAAWQLLRVATGAFEEERSEEAARVAAAARVLTALGGNLPLEEVGVLGIALIRELRDAKYNEPFSNSVAAAMAARNARSR